MEIYNKKGFLIGIMCCGVSIVCFIKDLVAPSDFTLLQMKHLLISSLMGLIGLNYISRAFSRKDTAEDCAEQENRRNQMIEVKSNAASFIILQRVLIAGTILSLITFYFTENLILIAILIITGLFLTLSWVIEIITAIYYGKKQQGDEF